MILYYGADKLITKPSYGVGNSTNDYGLGFYLTPVIEMAELWASKFKNGGEVITYDVNLTNLKILYLNTSNEKEILIWITLLISHRFSKDDYENNKNTIEWLKRHFSVDLSEYDVVIGYRADDSYFSYSLDFVRNELSLELLSEAMKLGKLGLQTVLISKKAFSRITYIESYSFDYSLEYENFRKKTLKEYKDIRKKDKINNTFIRDIMRKLGE